MTQPNATSPSYHVLLVEDNEDDVLITQHALKKIPVAIELHVAHDGIEALAQIERRPPYEDVPRPHVILLDLNMPRMDGRQLLAKLKRHEALKTIPVVILTTSAAEEDVLGTYRNHASAYITKPLGLAEFTSIAERFVAFWFSDTTVLPASCERAGLMGE